VLDQINADVEIKQVEKESLLKGDGIWTQFLIDDEKLRTSLRQFPNGPLFKILDLKLLNN
jgi:hypothetical protein